jgi:heterogeneous nuclear ribonucleoprotein U-like protein 1
MQPVDIEDTAPDQQHVCRFGISRGDDNVGKLNTALGLGALENFQVRANFWIAVKCSGLVIQLSVLLILNGFSKNGKWLGIAKKIDAGPSGLGVVDSPTRKLQWESALYPHVLLKNVVVELQFSVEEGLVPEEDYKPWASAVEDGSVLMGPSISKPWDCELMMMVGLPASGKSTWAEKWMKEHPEKRYVLLGTNLALDQMKVYVLFLLLFFLFFFEFSMNLLVLLERNLGPG